MKALQLNPDDYIAQFRLGMLYQRRKNLNNAVIWLRKSYPFYVKGLTLASDGKFSEAAGYLKKASDLGHPTAPQVLRQIRGKQPPQERGHLPPIVLTLQNLTTLVSMIDTAKW